MVEFLRFHRDCGPWRHPTDIAKPEIEAFLTHPATDRNVAPKTQNQAFWAILFLYKHLAARRLYPTSICDMLEGCH